MDVVFLSRLQFAVAAYFHFLFVPLTLGLSLLVAIMETRYARSLDDDYRRMARFWGKLFIINFAVGVVTGITLEFQFGTNWSRYSSYVGDIFGSLLAVEATVAFFLESTFIGLWIFGWKRLKPKAHAAVMWVVAGAANISAYWILSANAWMQHPVGYEIRNGRAELTDFLAVISQPFAIHTFIHTLSAAYVLAGFFVLAISGFHLLKKNETRFFGKSFKLAATWTFIFALVVVVHGHYNGGEVARTQPTKLAAMEALQCPTLLLNGYGGHRIEGIGDKHVPWIHNVRNTDLVIAVDDADPMRLLRLFNHPTGQEYLAGMGLDQGLIESLPLLGISGLGNLVAAIKMAKYYELTERDLVLTVFTDSMDLYRSRLAEMEETEGAYHRESAIRDYHRHLLGLSRSEMLELGHYDRKRIHNLKYFTWVEQQGKDAAELDAQWHDFPDYWTGIQGQTEEVDRAIRKINGMTGLVTESEG